MKIPKTKSQVTNKLERGFSLVEVLLYTGIFLILLTVFIQMLGSIISTQLESSSTSSASTDTKYVLARLNYDLSQAQNITSPVIGSQSSSLQFSVNNTQYTYALSNNNLVLTNANGTDQLNSSNTSVSSLSFTPVGSSSGKFTVEVSFTLKSTTLRNGTPETETIQTTIGNR